MILQNVLFKRCVYVAQISHMITYTSTHAGTHTSLLPHLLSAGKYTQFSLLVYYYISVKDRHLLQLVSFILMDTPVCVWMYDVIFALIYQLFWYLCWFVADVWAFLYDHSACAGRWRSQCVIYYGYIFSNSIYLSSNKEVWIWYEYNDASHI